MLRRIIAAGWHLHTYQGMASHQLPIEEEVQVVRFEFRRPPRVQRAREETR